MDAKEAKIAEILAGEKQYVIPVFQRPYTWDSENWKALWKDIFDLLSDSDNQFNHFIGPFITISQAKPYDVSRFLVIDGQQRLITVTLLLCALRDRATNLGLAEFAGAIHSNTLEFTDIDGGTKSKIIPRTRDRETLRRIIKQEFELLDSASLLAKAYRYFGTEIDGFVASGNSAEDVEVAESLKLLYQVIVRRLRLVMITLDDHDSPSNVFESLNFKGERLSDADLIRNYVFMQMKLEAQEAFENNVWKAFETEFEKESSLQTSLLTDFYYRYLTVLKDYFPKGKLYQTFQDHTNDRNISSDGTKLETLVHDLRTYARYYLRIGLHTQEPEEALRDSFQRFKYLDVATAIPLLMAIYSKYQSPDPSQKFTLSTFLLMLQAVESFVIRRSIMRARTRGYGLDFARASKNIESYDNLVTYLDNRGWPSDDAVSEQLQTFPIYHHEKDKAQLILREIERSLDGKERIDLSTLTIEHVMPQNLNMSWQSALGDEAEVIHEKFVHTLGNLTLTGYNPELSDRPFVEKKERLGTKICLNQHFQQHDTWSETQIRERSRYLASKLLERWPKPNITENMRQKYSGSATQ